MGWDDIGTPSKADEYQQEVVVSNVPQVKKHPANFHIQWFNEEQLRAAIQQLQLPERQAEDLAEKRNYLLTKSIVVLHG